MTITGRPVFSSPHSLDIEVFVDCENIVQGNYQQYKEKENNHEDQ